MRDIILMVGDVSDIYVTNFGKMMNDGNFSPRELDAIAFGYTRLLESNGVLQDLRQVINVSTLSMTDKRTAWTWWTAATMRCAATATW